MTGLYVKKLLEPPARDTWEAFSTHFIPNCWRALTELDAKTREAREVKRTSSRLDASLQILQQKFGGFIFYAYI